MAARVGNPHVQHSSPVAMDNIQSMLDRWTNDIMKQGIAAQEDHAREVLRDLKDTLKASGFKADGRRNDAEQLQRMIVDFQRERGLPASGRLDDKTVNALKDANMLQRPDAPVQAQKAEAQGGETGGKLRVEHEVQQEVRQIRMQQEVSVKNRVEMNEKPQAMQQMGDKHDAHQQSMPQQQSQIDPERLLAQLINAGFKGPGGSQGLEDALKKFQMQMGLPTSGQLDKPTVDALKQKGMIPDDAATAKAVKEAVDTKTPVRRALQEQASTATKAADKQPDRDPLRPQAQAKDPARTSDVAARASAADQHPVAQQVQRAEQMRVDNATAQQQALMRGVVEGTGDPAATMGNGAVAGQGAGLGGAGQGVGGAAGADGEGSLEKEEGPKGDETATGNASSGDENFALAKKGQAQLDEIDADEEGEGGHYEVPKISDQIRRALETVERDDDGTGVVTYMWDVTIYKPGIYAARQKAEPLWHLRIDRATAFDPIWTEARNTLTRRMFYMEPNGDPPTEHEFILALRRARVR